MLSRIIIAALPLLASAAPAPEADFLSSIVKRADAPSTMSQCNIAAIKMDRKSLSALSQPSPASCIKLTEEPTAAGLPPPSSGLILDHIAVGRGTQNYTCDNATSTAIPKAIGAVATLFNVTCMAGPYTSLLDVLPSIALKFPVPDANAVLSPANLFLSGHHYFTNATTPFFNLNTAGHNWGLMGCSKLNATNAPKTDTDVPNLKLATKTRDGCAISEVYRLNTAGGQPPKTCSGMPKSFEVQYAAEYWFWNNPKLGQYS
jgi:hypothetical protein